MTRIWKYVAIVVIVLLAFGALLAGAGLLTGAVPERVMRVLESGGHLDAARRALEAAGSALRSIF